MQPKNILTHLLNAFEKIFPDIKIQGGADEPFYQASKMSQPAIIFFRKDYSRSLLHEISHFCLSSDPQRKLDDFGLWYIPTGRSLDEQLRFEKVEARPQGLEWVLCDVVGIPFEPSLDDFSGRSCSNAFLENLKLAKIEMVTRPPQTARQAIEGLKDYVQSNLSFH